MPTKTKTKSPRALKSKSLITVEIDRDTQRIIQLDTNYAPKDAGYTAMLTIKKNSRGIRTYFWVISSTKSDGISTGCELKSKIPPDVGAK